MQPGVAVTIFIDVNTFLVDNRDRAAAIRIRTAVRTRGRIVEVSVEPIYRLIVDTMTLRAAFISRRLKRKMNRIVRVR